MNLIDTYINQVGDNLPAKDRDDIKAEIRSILEDTLENRSQESGRPVDDSLIVEVLKEFGTPRKMAAAYLPARYLIGPRLYPTFMMVLKIVLGIIALVTIITTSVSTAQHAQTLQGALPLITRGLMEGLSSMLAALGNIVFIFAIIEWAMSRAKEEAEKGNDWDPRSMDDRTDSGIVKPWERIPDIVFNLGALLVFNFYPQWIALYFTDQVTGSWVRVPFLSPTFFQYLPLLNILWLLGLALSFALMRAGQWQPWSKWFQIAINILTIIVFIMMASGDPIITYTMESLNQIGSTGENIASLQPLIQKGVSALLILLIVLTGVDTVKSLVGIFRKK